MERGFLFLGRLEMYIDDAVEVSMIVRFVHYCISPATNMVELRNTCSFSELYCKNTLDPLPGKGALNSTKGLSLLSVPG
jgi:hypothetical protein